MDGTKTCPYCGKLAAADAQFCQGCGRSISSPQQYSAEQQPQQNYQQPQQNYQQPQQDYQQQPQQGGWQQPPQQPPQQQGWQQPAPAYGAPGQMSYGSGARGQIAGAIQNRNITDVMMSGFWALWPILSIIIAAVIGIVLIVALAATLDVAGLFIGVILTVVIAIFLFALLNYKLLKRMDEHRKREMALRMATISYLKDKGAETQRAQLIANEISALESINQEAMYKEKERTPVLWTIVSLIPLLNLVVMYFLGEFPFDHDKRWHAFTQYTQVACQKLGINVMTPSWSTLKERPNLLLLIGVIILTFVTGLGLILMILWYYFIIKDLNEHFQAQWQFEDQLMAQLR